MCYLASFTRITDFGFFNDIINLSKFLGNTIITQPLKCHPPYQLKTFKHLVS